MPKTAVVSQPLTRPMLVVGCERVPLGLVVGGGAGLLLMAWMSFSVVALVGGLATFSGGLGTLRRMAKNDPQWWQVYMQNRKFRDFYHARSTPFRKG